MKRLIPATLVVVASFLSAPDASAVIPEKGSIAVFAGVGPILPFEGDYDLGFQIEGGASTTSRRSSGSGPRSATPAQASTAVRT